MTFTRIAALLLALFLHTAATAGDAQQLHAQGLKQMRAEQYEAATKSFREETELSPDDGQAWYSLGIALEYQNQSGQAAGALAKAAGQFRAALAKNDDDGDLWFSLGLCHEHQNHLELEVTAMQKAVERLAAMRKPNATVAEAQNRVRYAQESQKLRAQPASTGEPTNLGALVNSPADETFPAMSPDGHLITFTSRRPGGQGGEDLYVTERENTVWGAPRSLPAPLNSTLHEGAATLTGDGQSIIFTACGRPDSVGGCDLYGSTLQGARWTLPKSLGPVVNSTDWDGQPALSPDGDTLVFASRRSGGVGKSDLWLVKRQTNGAWGPPRNLGEPVNTPFSEQSPSLSPDGKTLYFASAGHPGMGRMDIFRTVLEDGHWSEPTNLGAPLNSEQDDKFFTVGGAAELGYFASKRAGGVGGYDLYSVPVPATLRPEPTLVISGTITDTNTRTPMDADLLIEDLASGYLVSKERSNSATGKYVVVLPAGRTYSVSVSHAGYFFFSSRFAVPKGSGYKELTKDMRLQPIEKGAHAVLNNVFFETNKAELSPDSRLELDKAAELLRKNPRLVLEVGGHTDNVGKTDANLKLSGERALVVRDHLIAAGIGERRLRAKGYGQSVPVGENRTEEGRQANRRTELVVLED